MSESSSRGTIGLDKTVSERVRHAISAGLSFINASVENLATSKPDVPHALRMFSVGTGKLKSAIAELDKSKETITATALGYNGTVEKKFTDENAEVAKWTVEFQERVAALNIFSEFEKKCPQSQVRAVVIGSLWHRFSSFMPWFLCQAAAKVSTNEKRHYVIQTAFEELGMRDAREIHPDMFWEAAQSAGVSDENRNRALSENLPAAAIESLRATLLAYDSDEEVLGILLGLEIPAKENIETVFLSLAHTDALKGSLNQHKFFQLHRQIEPEHVRLTVANFLRFCTTDEQRKKFTRGFTDGLNFWKSFSPYVRKDVAPEKLRIPGAKGHLENDSSIRGIQKVSRSEVS